VSDYRRDLNLDTAIASVSYTRGGVRFTREIFTSAVDGVLVVRLSADKPGRISFSASLDTPQNASLTTQGDTVVMGGVGGGSGRNGVAGALKWECRARVLPQNGALSADGESVTVTGADSALILLDAATSYKTYKDISGDPSALARGRIQKASAKKFEQLRAAHIADHRRLFRRVAFDLGTSAGAALPTDERLRAFAQKPDDLALAALYFQFGRYLLIARRGRARSPPTCRASGTKAPRRPGTRSTPSTSTPR
jgi:alpha-L-fucosidase 2